MVVYMICGLFSSSFITNFVFVTILLMLDFWTVRLPTPQLLLPKTLGCNSRPSKLVQQLGVAAVQSSGATRSPSQSCAVPSCNTWLRVLTDEERGGAPAGGPSLLE